MVSDHKRPLDLNTDGLTDAYAADIYQWSDYYPFGMVMPGRSGSVGGYRFGFQGQETDDEIYGAENAVSFKYRVHDPRVGRFLSVDPMAGKYPWNSPYAFSENRVMDAVELEGLEYLDKDEARIHITQGVVKLNLANFHQVTVNVMRRQLGPAQMDQDPYGNPSIGLNRTLFSFHHPASQLVSPSPSPAGVDYPGPIRNLPGRRVFTNVFIQSVEQAPVSPSFSLPPGTMLTRPLRKNGQPDMRCKVNREYWPALFAYFEQLSAYRHRQWATDRINKGLSAMPAKARAANGIFLLMDMGGMALEWTANMQIGEDKERLIGDLEMLMRAMNDVGKAVEDGEIPLEYMNTVSLSAIINYVLLGENTTSDLIIEELGNRVIECYSSPLDKE